MQEALLQAGTDSYERTDARKAHRNGYKDRSFKIRYGETILWKPQFRELPFETQVFGRYAQVEMALVNAVVEFYLQDVSTRKTPEIVAHLGIDHLFPASVSRMTKNLDDQVQAFPLQLIEQATLYLFVNASYYKNPGGARHVTKAVLIVAVREDGYREILGARVMDCENEAFWSGFFENLKEWGLAGV